MGAIPGITPDKGQISSKASRFKTVIFSLTGPTVDEDYTKAIRTQDEELPFFTGLKALKISLCSEMPTNYPNQADLQRTKARGLLSLSPARERLQE